jgi:heme O synthase-like polyprenyltransferase
VKKLIWQPYERPVPRHPYRDTALIYGVLAGVVVAIAAATGVSIVKAVIIAVVVFLGSTIYSWWYWRDRLRKREEGEE